MILKTRSGIDKYRKVAGAGQRHADWIAPNKVAAFKVLFDKIRASVGTYRGAKEFIGLSGSSIDAFEKGKISALNGRRILEAYQRIQEKANDLETL